MVIIETIAGYAIAILVNLFVPQLVKQPINYYRFWGLEIRAEQAYRALLIIFILIYVLHGICAKRNLKSNQKYRKKAALRLAAGIALALWDIGGTKLAIFPQPFFPGPTGIAEAFLMEPGYILQNTFYSLRLFTTGFVLGVIIGVATGILIGWFPKVNYWLSPILNICGIIPAVAWMPFALILFPTSFAAAAFLIVICTWFPVASMTAQGIVSTPKLQFEAAKTLGAKPVALIFHLALPHALPQIFVGVTTAEAFAFTTLVMAEMMGQPGGLGYYINASKVWSAYYKVFAAIIVMAILFSLISKGIEAVESFALRWQKGVVK